VYDQEELQEDGKKRREVPAHLLTCEAKVIFSPNTAVMGKWEISWWRREGT